MTERELILMAVDMRKLQREYFKTRRTDILDQCRVIERQFDKEAAKYLDPQASMLA